MYIHKHNNYCITYNINMQTHKFMYSVTVVHKKTAALDTHGITIYTEDCAIDAYNHDNKNHCHMFGIYL